MAVAVTRKELGAGELRREAKRCRDAKAARRMLALALVLEGASREEAARAAGMDRQTLRDWVHRSKGEGLPGLPDRGRPRPGGGWRAGGAPPPSPGSGPAARPGRTSARTERPGAGPSSPACR